jgi:hypothetical protein
MKRNLAQPGLRFPSVSTGKQDVINSYAVDYILLSDFPRKNGVNMGYAHIYTVFSIFSEEGLWHPYPFKM